MSHFYPPFTKLGLVWEKADFRKASATKPDPSW